MTTPKPTTDDVLDALDETLHKMVGESWEMNNIEVEDGGVTMTVTFWDCQPAEEEE